jgi:DNA polymerase delta subunit 2
MFGAVSTFSSFTCETNPTYFHITSGSESELASSSSRAPISRTLLVNSGQPLNDMFKYLPSPPSTRLSLAESTLRWRHMAPTAPDTLWCHPFFSKEPFVIRETPDLYLIGNQPRFQTRMVTGESDEGGSGEKRCRVVLVPGFAETGMLVLVNLKTLGVKCVRFAVEGMTGGEEIMNGTGELA